MWVYYDPIAKKAYVCMEGAVYGYCVPGHHEITKAQQEAAKLLLEIINEYYPKQNGNTIDGFNDTPGRTQEEAAEIFKLAIIRDEAENAEDGLDDEDIDNLLEFKDSMK